jgi:hypothetical protein
MEDRLLDLPVRVNRQIPAYGAACKVKSASTD